MRLMIDRSQSKGLLGGATSFEVKARAELSDDERRLVQHYKLEKSVLLAKKGTFLGRPIDQEINVTVKQIVDGEVFKCKDLSEVISYTESLVEACQTLLAYLDVAKRFGGQEVIEIHPPKA